MPGEKRVRDLMIPWEDYPHLPEWFTLRQAIAMIREEDLAREGALEPWAPLVFDEISKQPLGLLTLRDIFGALASGFFQGTGPQEEEPCLTRRHLFAPGWKEASLKPLREVMSPIKVTIPADESLARAIFLMIKENLDRLPVVQDNRVVGMIRLSDLFREVSDLILGNGPEADYPSPSED